MRLYKRPGRLAQRARIRFLLALGLLAALVPVCIPGAAAEPPASAFTFGYDDLGRLIEASVPTGNTAFYGWDAVGNLTSIKQKTSLTVYVSKLAPNSGPVGGSIRIYGTDFSPTSASDTVTFAGSATATVTSASPTELDVSVPSGAKTGKIKVVTPAGSGSSETFTLTASKVPTISSVSAALATAGTAFSVTGTGFDTTAANDSLAINQGEATVSSATSTKLESTIPSVVGSGQLTLATQYGEATGPDVYIPPEGVSASEVVQTARMSVGGTREVNIASEGKDAMVIFDAKAGQRVFVNMTEPKSLKGCCGAEVALYDIHNQPIGSLGFVNETSGGYIDTTTLPSTGTYTTFVSTGKTSSGSFNLNVSEVPEDMTASITPSESGGSQSFENKAAGQNASLTFAGTAGQRIFLAIPTSEWKYPSGCCNVLLSVQNPDGTPLVSSTYIAGGSFIDTTTLPATGTYTISLDPRGTTTGSGAVTAYLVPEDATGSIAPSESGATQSFETKAVGQNATLTFSGTAGQRIFLNVPSGEWHYPSGCCDVQLSVKNPDGSTLITPTFIAGGSYSDTTTLPATGTYTIYLDPKGATTGSGALTAYLVPEDTTASIAPSESGGTHSFETKAVGQNASLTFSGTAGQRIFLNVPASEWKYPSGCCNVQLSVQKPDGTKLVNPTFISGGSNIDTVTLPTTGTYTILLDPKGANTGSGALTAYLVPVDSSGSIEIGGSAVTVTTTVPGQNAALTFSGTASKTIKLTASNVKFGSSACCSTRISILNPEGGTLVSPKFIGTSGGTIEATLTVAGTYTIFVDPQAEATGSMTLSLTDPPGPSAVHRVSRRGDHASSVEQARPSALGPTTSAARAAHHTSPIFTTSVPARWSPSARDRHGEWRIDLPNSPLQQLLGLQATGQTTALSGQTLKLNGMPLAGVTVSLEDTDVQARTDSTGRFLLSGAPVGHQVLVIEGASADNAQATYGRFEIGVELQRGIASALPYTIWMPALDEKHVFNLPSPTRGQTTLRTPEIPGLEIHIPGGTVITDADGHRVHQLTVTAVPVDRPPFPLPMGSEIPLYFTVQPGGAYLSKGVQIVYPNYTKLSPGQRVPFWNYDPDKRGWFVYGQGTVTASGGQITPDRGVDVWQFSGAMISGSPPPPLWWDPFCWFVGACQVGEPVDLNSGLYVMRKTDLYLHDVMPLALTRTYRPSDNNSYAFGIGTSDSYDLRLWSTNNYHEADLIMPGGSRVHYVCAQSCVLGAGILYRATSTPGVFFGSTITYENGWNLRLRTGLTYHFPDLAPLAWIRDRFGNQITITRDANTLSQVSSPHGHWISFAHDSHNRITQAHDDSGRTVKYEYDSSGRLAKVTDVAGGATSYTYDSKNQLLSVIDPRQVTYVTNHYDANGRVDQQQTGDGAIYKYSYTGSSETNKVSQGSVTNPDGDVVQANYNADGFPTSVTRAAGTPSAETTSYEVQPGTDFLTGVTDALSRKTSYTYDSLGNLATITRMAGSEGARTTTLTHDPIYSRLTSVTDPLGHTRSAGYDSLGELTSVTDPLNHTRSAGYSGHDGEPTSSTDPLGHTTTHSYRLGEPVLTTDPLGHMTKRFFDGAGRELAVTDALGSTTRLGYDPFDDVTTVTDPDAGETKLGYDADGNLVSFTDALGHKTSATYDPLDRLSGDTDALEKSDAYAYDGNGNLTSWTDRKGQVTTLGYDALNRRNFIGYGTTGKPPVQIYASTIGATYDKGNRLTEAVDSVGGTFKDSSDSFNELTDESGPNGSVHYGYDAAGRRTATTVAGQPEVTYGYDNANRLTAIGGSHSAALAYDGADRLTGSTLPDGIHENYSYDNASELAGINYELGGTTLGELNYAYDPDGERTATWGSYARLNLPKAVSSATYNADNELTARGTHTSSYDADGNLTAEGTATEEEGSGSYRWNARNQLTSALVKKKLSSFSYDPFGRREQEVATNGTTTNFLYDGQNVAQELLGSTPQVNYTLGLGLDHRYSRSDSSGTQSFLTDALGSTVALASSAGSVQTSYTYDPFGQPTSSGATSSNQFQFTGLQNDGNGLQYNRARYYSPSVERFISQDPWGIAASGPDLYSYAGDDPINRSDPTGRDVGVVKGGYDHGEGYIEADPEGANVGVGVCLFDCGSSVETKPGERKSGPGGELCLSALCWSPGEGFHPGDPFGGGGRGWVPIPVLPGGGIGGVKRALSDVPSSPGPILAG
jgi:RHS repeat-associated protein